MAAVVEASKRSRSVLYAAMLLALLVLIVMFINVLYTNRVGQDSVRRANENARRLQQTQCAVIVTIDNGYRKAPPQSETGKELAKNIRELRQSLGCN
jgi:HAMP domain-containing protein